MLRSSLATALVGICAVTHPISAASASEPVYDNRYDKGALVHVGTAGGLEVRMSVRKGDDLAVTLCVVNNTDRPVTFFPESVTVESIRHGKDTVRREAVRVFSATEYKSRLETSLAWKTLLVGMGNSQQAAPETYNVSGTSSSQAHNWSDGTTVTGKTDYSRTVTKQPTEADRQAAADRAQTRTEKTLAPVRAGVQESVVGLMQTQTVDPHAAYGGTIYAKAKGKEYVATVPFGGTNFQFNVRFK